MKILGIEIKREPRPNLSRDVIPALSRLIDSLSDGQIELTRRVDELAKQVEATRRKVYRDRADQLPGPDPDPETPELAFRPAGNGAGHPPRTGDPA